MKVDAEVTEIDWQRGAGPILVRTETDEILCLHPWEIERKATTLAEIDALLDGRLNREV